jgi:signal transduction histidine kinase
LENYIHEITILKDYNENIIQSIRIGMIIINHAFVVEKVNNAFLEAFNLQESQVIGIPFQKLQLTIIDEEILQHARAILQRQQEAYTKMTRVQRNHVYELKLYAIGSHDAVEREAEDMLGCILVVEDISRKMEFEEKIFQAEKLSSISMLSAGVAHEINNPLSSIMTNVQNLIDEEEDDERRTSLKWIEQETRRIARIVQELLEFSSSNLDRTQETDVNSVIEETISLIRYSLKSSQDVSIRTDLETDIPLVLMSQDEFKQTIINLVKNAIQAIGVKGEILLTSRKKLTEQVVWVTVQDNGTGIREGDISRVFDPFYTTKHNGEGTGLGLSVVYGIINKYQGTITVESQEGEGTQIRLAIPVLETF